MSPFAGDPDDHADRSPARPGKEPTPVALPADAPDPPLRGATGEVASARPDPRRLPHLRRPGGDRRRRLRPSAARTTRSSARIAATATRWPRACRREQLIAELYGRATGCSRGRGGSMHLFAPEVGLMGTSGIVGPCILQAAGAGYSFKLLKTDRVAVAFFGDGAVNNGAFHEGLNLASIWKLPVLFVCENNQYATEVPFHYAAGNPTVAVAGRLLRPAGRRGGRQRRAGGPRGGRRSGAPRPRRRRADAARVPDLPHPAARRGHGRLHLPHARRSRGVEDALPDPAAAAAARWRPASTSDELDAHGGRDRARRSRRPTAFAEQSPWPDPATATDARLRRAGAPRSGRRRSGRRRAREITFMQATLEALSDEMAHNPTIFVLGEGIGKRGGNFKTTAGLYDLYGPERLCDTPICERGFVGLGCGAAMTGTRPVDRFHVRRLRPRRRRRDRQPDRQDAVHEQRPAQDADPAARLHRHRPLGGHAPLRQLLPDVRPLPRPARRRALDALRRQGAAAPRPALRRSRCCSWSTASCWR